VTRRRVLTVCLVIAAVALGLLRAAGVKSVLFQANAHLFVGGLIGAYAVGRDKLYLWLAVALSVVETICFFLV
jgi:hypothetical protein